MKTMLVPLDGSSRSETVLPVVIALAGGGKYRVTLFSVCELLPGQLEDMGEEHARELRTYSMKYFRAYLAKVAEALAKEGIEVTTEVCIGHPTAIILAAIRELEPDLVAMASGGRGGVTDRVVRGSVEPVLVLGPRLLEAWPPREVQVSSALSLPEDSVGAQCTLPVARDMAREAGTHGALLNVHYEVLREKVEELIDMAIGCRSGHQWPRSRIGGRR